MSTTHPVPCTVTSTGTALGDGPDVRAALAVQQRQFSALAAEIHLDAPVPACPGWRALDVVTHLTGVHAWAGAMARTAPGSPAPDDTATLDTATHDTATPVSRGPVAAYAAAAAALRRTLDEDPTRPCLTLRGTGVAADWNRRQLHETLVHTWDLADAARLPRWGAADVVADAVAEVLDTLAPRQVRLGRMPAPVVAVELLGSHRWVLGAGPVVASVAGPDADLLRLLWRRSPWVGTGAPDGLVVTGDAVRARSLLALPLTP